MLSSSWALESPYSPWETCELDRYRMGDSIQFILEMCRALLSLPCSKGSEWLTGKVEGMCKGFIQIEGPELIAQIKLGLSGCSLRLR